MNHLGEEVSVLPLYNQLAIQDVGTKDIPEWETGREHAVSTATCILIATRPDMDGPVTVRVFEGVPDKSTGSLIFEGSLRLSSAEIQIGSIISDNFTSIGVKSPGLRRLKIFGQPPEAPHLIDVILDSN